MNDAEREAQEYEVHILGLQDNAWEEYLMTGKPEALARFVELGGEIDDDARRLIAAHLRGERGIVYPNRSNHWRDYSVYTDVRQLMLFHKIGIIEARRRFILQQGKFSKDDQNFPEAVHTVYQQYKRGEKAGAKGGPVYDEGEFESE